MKRFVALLLILTMVLGCSFAFADTSVLIDGCELSYLEDNYGLKFEEEVNPIPFFKDAVNCSGNVLMLVYSTNDNNSMSIFAICDGHNYITATHLEDSILTDLHNWIIAQIAISYWDGICICEIYEDGSSVCGSFGTLELSNLTYLDCTREQFLTAYLSSYKIK